jgi:hypothetical protein
MLSTVATLNNSTSQKPMDLRSCGSGWSALEAEGVIESPGVREEFHPAFENHKRPDASYSRIHRGGDEI